RAGLDFGPERSVYYASKWAITGFTKCMQVELSGFGIKVINFHPDKMDTKLFEKVGIDKDMSNALNVNEVAEVVAFVINTKGNLVISDFVIRHFDLRIE
ncbi:SDR family oxidoreductase, partial [Candidatus Dojkabacteria bacterium]|nr:SDR family oxidoreductase [Candidatus Dojkabacteria bacterium]